MTVVPMILTCPAAGKRDRVLQIIRLVKARDNGMLTREECDRLVAEVVSPQIQLPMEVRP